MSDKITTPDGKQRPVDAWPRLIAGFGPDGKPVAAAFGADGRLLVTGDSGGGGSPTGGATEAKQTEGIALLRSTMGQHGSDFVADTVAHAGAYEGVIAVTDVEIAAITLGANSTGAAALAGVRLAAGQQLLAPLTSITLASGVAQLIKAAAL